MKKKKKKNKKTTPNRRNKPKPKNKKTHTIHRIVGGGWGWFRPANPSWGLGVWIIGRVPGT